MNKKSFTNMWTISTCLDIESSRWKTSRYFKVENRGCILSLKHMDTVEKWRELLYRRAHQRYWFFNVAKTKQQKTQKSSITLKKCPIFSTASSNLTNISPKPLLRFSLDPFSSFLFFWFCVRFFSPCRNDFL